jgi:hypothetical protein
MSTSPYFASVVPIGGRNKQHSAVFVFKEGATFVSVSATEFKI